PTFNDYMNKLIDSYKKQNPKIEIEWVDLPSKEIEQKTLTSIAGGKSPDVINLNPAFTAKLAEEGALTDLETTVSKDVKDLYLPNIWKSTSFGNKTYGFPWYLSTAITIYNKDIFTKAGLKADSPPKTFDDLKKMGETIKAKTGKYLYMPNFGDSGKILEFMAQQGIKIISDDNTKAVFNTSETEKFIDFWIDLSKKGIIPQNSITQGHREAIDKFQAGETALLVSGPQFLNIIKQNAPKLYDSIGISSQLTGISNKTGVGVMNLVIPDASKNKVEATKFAQFITNKENQLEFCKLVTILPSITEASKDKYFTTLSAKPTLEEEARKISAEQLKTSTVLLPTVKKWSELSKSFDQYFQQAYLGQITTKEALKKAQDDWDQILKVK
ncbi:MAG: sugar ABC transporter substrate-binding protein, partial [Candidatus Sericytochromatia bacterium]|nr:sugar ABC transporter substrate-binding protein [Candidatus Sericytochromatia bacterium]